MFMRNRQTAGRRFAAAFALAIMLLTAGVVGASKCGLGSAALADDSEPDYLVLNPERE